MQGYKFDFSSISKGQNNKDNKNDTEKKPFQFNFNFGNNTTNQAASTTPGSFNFGGILQKLTFNFGTGVEFQAEKKEFGQQGNFGTFAPFKLNPASTPKQQEEETKPDEIDNALCESEVTGEEGEECLLDAQANMYQFVKEVPKKEESDKKEQATEPKPKWAERGAGEFHFNYNKEHKFYRMILRRNPLKTIILNQRVFKGMNPKRVQKNAIQILGTFISSDKKDSQIDVLLLRFKDQTVADRLMELLDKAIKECE